MLHTLARRIGAHRALYPSLLTPNHLPPSHTLSHSLNHSYSPNRCSAEHPFVEEALGRLALRRLRSLFHVGAFERLTESMASLAGQLGLDLDGPAYASPPVSSNGTER